MQSLKEASALKNVRRPRSVGKEGHMATTTKVYQCTGQLPGGKQCTSKMSVEAGFVPPFPQIVPRGIPTVAQLEGAVLCDSCARRAGGRMYRLGASLEVAEKKHGPARAGLGELFAEKMAAERVAMEVRREVQGERLHRQYGRLRQERSLRALAASA